MRDCFPSCGITAGRYHVHHYYYTLWRYSNKTINTAKERSGGVSNSHFMATGSKKKGKNEFIWKDVIQRSTCIFTQAISTVHVLWWWVGWQCLDLLQVSTWGHQLRTWQVMLSLKWEQANHITTVGRSLKACIRNNSKIWSRMRPYIL